MRSLRHLTAVLDDNRLVRLARLAAARLHPPHQVLALHDAAEHDVLAVQPVGDRGGDEELGPVRVRAAIGHGQQVGLGVLVLEVLVLELAAVDRHPAGPVPAREVTALAHEVGDDAVEAGPLVMEPSALFSGAESSEVLRGSRHVGVELWRRSKLDTSCKASRCC